MENLETMEKANERIAILKQKIREMEDEMTVDKKIEISTKNVIRQMSSSDLLDELMRRENSKEELEKIAIGFILKKIDFEESSINAVLQMIMTKNAMKKIKEASLK